MAKMKDDFIVSERAQENLDKLRSLNLNVSSAWADRARVVIWYGGSYDEFYVDLAKEPNELMTEVLLSVYRHGLSRGEGKVKSEFKNLLGLK